MCSWLRRLCVRGYRGIGVVVAEAMWCPLRRLCGEGLDVLGLRQALRFCFGLGLCKKVHRFNCFLCLLLVLRLRLMLTKSVHSKKAS